MIPKIIHQIWLGEKPIPEKFKKWRGEIIKLHSTKRFSNWKHYLWTDENIAEFGAEKLLNECETLAAKSDVIRLLAIARYGGIYLDMDIECLKSLQPLINVPLFAAKESDDNICNAVFGAVKNHPSILSQIKLLPDLVYKPTTWGVKLMTEHLNKITSGATLYPKEFFYPFLWDMPMEYKEISPESYLVHHWEGSWNK